MKATRKKIGKLVALLLIAALCLGCAGITGSHSAYASEDADQAVEQVTDDAVVQTDEAVADENTEVSAEDTAVAKEVQDQTDDTKPADSVTEEILRNLMGNYHLVLISTHGYFAEAATMGTDISPASTDTQLSQSCLFLAGAETNMRNRQFNSSMPDGILSARELSSMNLSDVDLVSLSACQSGLGFVTTDGVFGLQRGLKTAGVKAVIASLWEVDDQATITLMINLYKNLQAGMSLQNAFTAARHGLEHTVVQKTYPRKGVADLVVTKRYNLPHFYNAFILIDGIE